MKVIVSNTFANQQQLVELHLYNNEISSIPQSAFVNLPKLQELFLYSNQIRNIETLAFSNLPQLQVLRLDGNKLETIDRGSFKGLGNLQELQLQNNLFVSIQTVQYQFPVLTHLYLNNNSITGIPDDAFSRQPKLVTLHLHSNRISTLSTTAFKELTQLNTLYLYNNHLTKLPEHLFTGLSDLRDLRLDNNLISDIFLNSFTGMSNLSFFSLSENKITSFPIGALSKIPSISALDLQNNQMQVLPLSAYDKLASISTVNIENNPWHCDCRMVPFRQVMTGSRSFENQITCQEPSSFIGKKLKNISPEDLICEDPTIVRFERSDDVQLVHVQVETLHLVCEVSGIPTPDIIVYLPSGQNVTFESGGRVTMGVDGTITIRDVTTADAGLYICIAKSSAGSTYALLSVGPSSLPPIQQSQSVSNSEIAGWSLFGLLLLAVILFCIRFFWCKEVPTCTCTCRCPPASPDNTTCTNTRSEVRDDTPLKETTPKEICEQLQSNNDPTIQSLTSQDQIADSSDHSAWPSSEFSGPRESYTSYDNQ
ncbi:leucine-rich repeat-containing protein 15-like [Branchiostoma floridae]|uniref:Leucine-rich repeat-containing protein 15-like n=1 Tax=Branchiostoma floridae TaxID=7739 RepID=A0A9J7LU84_BRAFL|nr:leucine-rich repeat-containing protein 15-like [Branchiostoma floridae]